MESPGRPPPSPQLPHQLHGHMHWSPFFFPKSIKMGYFLWHNLKATIFIWQNSLLVSIFNDISSFWCDIRSAGGMLLIASTNDRGYTGWKMTPNGLRKIPGSWTLWKLPLLSLHVIQSLDEFSTPAASLKGRFSFLLTSQHTRQSEFHTPISSQTFSYRCV